MHFNCNTAPIYDEWLSEITFWAAAADATVFECQSISDWVLEKDWHETWKDKELSHRKRTSKWF